MGEATVVIMAEEASSMSNGILYIKDSRTSLEYEIPIQRNSVEAAEFKKIKCPAEGSCRADKVANGLRIYDPRLLNTAVSENHITWADGERGFLLFHGYTLEELSGTDFEDILHLMIWEELPTASQREVLRYSLATAMTKIPPSVPKLIKSFPPSTSAPPMPIVIAGLSAWLASEPDSIPSLATKNIFHGNLEKVDEAIIRTIAAYGVVLGLTISHRKGCEFTPPSPDKTFYENIFIMSGNIESSTAQSNPTKLSCFRRWGPVIVDHGMTNSTFALRVTSSSLTDPISSLIGALTACSGLLHFGAQEAAYRTIAKVGTPENVPTLIEKVKRKELRLYGYGHASYKTIDPRVAPVLELLKELGTDSIPFYDVAEAIHMATEHDEYFVKRELFPNVDHYSQFFYPTLGFGCEYSPVLSFLQRLPGFMAHWKDMMSGSIRLIRPTDIYIGPTEPRGGF